MPHSTDAKLLVALQSFNSNFVLPRLQPIPPFSFHQSTHASTPSLATSYVSTPTSSIWTEEDSMQFQRAMQGSKEMSTSVCSYFLSGTTASSPPFSGLSGSSTSPFPITFPTVAGSVSNFSPPLVMTHPSSSQSTLVQGMKHLLTDITQAFSVFHFFVSFSLSSKSFTHGGESAPQAVTYPIEFLRLEYPSLQLLVLNEKELKEVSSSSLPSSPQTN